MVHLGRVSTDKDLANHVVQNLNLGDIDLGPEAGQDEFTASVYGSKYAAADLPKHEMPDDEMPKEVAYRMIKDDLTLDGTPTLK